MSKSTFIKLPFVIKILVLSIFEWPFYTHQFIVEFHNDLQVLFTNPLIGLKLIIIVSSCLTNFIVKWLTFDLSANVALIGLQTYIIIEHDM